VEFLFANSVYGTNQIKEEHSLIIIQASSWAILISFDRYMTCAKCGTGNDYPYEALGCIQVVSGVRVSRSLDFCVMFCW
jgi:hypothetical protein